ncbi:PF20097 family protein [uncultured Sphingomonas sp.]|uniref:PF20097 family protein n=1 Tax=uncultured Sphingomonas sp. TaxID=158754 RepID=UPI0025D40A73|nr:PF20097 family protein [uncultured Sphingomonas sp.]
MRPSDCPKCQGTMEEGFLLDESYGTRGPADWVEGSPEKSIWTGVKLGDRMRLPIETWRCGRCGYLESYAR